jgi:hypothetical protein
MNTIDILEELAELLHINPVVSEKLSLLNQAEDWQNILNKPSYFATEEKVVSLE